MLDLVAVWKFRYFWMSLVKMDLMTRYRRSVLGILWSLLYPLGMTAIFCLVFTKLVGGGWAGYAKMCLCGMAVFNFLRDCTVNGCNSLIRHEGYIRQTPLPFAIYSLRTVLSGGVHFLITLAVLLLVVAFLPPARMGDDGEPINTGTHARVKMMQRAASASPPLATGTGAICGFVYEDANGDGVRDATEAPVHGVTVVLRAPNGGGGTDEVARTVTDQDGFYRFADLAPGQYWVQEVQPDGYADGQDAPGSTGGLVQVNDFLSAVPVAAGTESRENNFGEVPPPPPAGVMHLLAGGDWGVFARLWKVLLVLPLTLLFCWAMATITGFLTVYFHDISHLLELVAQFLFFATPVIWLRNILDEKGVGWMVDWNPAAAFIELYRDPLVYDRDPSQNAILLAVGSTAFAVLVASLMVRRLSKRVIFQM